MAGNLNRARRGCEGNNYAPGDSGRVSRARLAEALLRFAHHARRSVGAGACALWVTGVAVSCGGGAPPEPRSAAAELRDAVRRRDAGAVHALLDESSRRRITVQEVAALLERDGEDMLAQMALAVGAKSHVEVRAEVVLPRGERVALIRENHGYSVEENNGLMGFAVTPREALLGLRTALAQPDYGLLLQLLAADVREQIESRRMALIEALEDLDAVNIAVRGDRAIVDTADGHRVELELESGVWRIRDFE